MKKLLTSLIIFFSISSIVFAEDISVDQLLGTQDKEISQNVEKLEQQRTEEIENELNISIPAYTDNPSHIITFVDPSEEKVGVELDIDESGYKDIKSPYSLPSLNIGEHHLKFRFTDSIGAVKVLEYDLVIIPRPPVLKAPSFDQNDLLISGTGLANSEIVLTVSVGADNYTQNTDIDGEGNWSTSVTMDSVANGIYTIFGYTRKDGYASNPSEPAVFEYGSSGIVDTNTEEKNSISFDFRDITLSDLPGIIASNPDLIIILISFLLFGGLVASLIFIITRRIQQKSDEDQVSSKMDNHRDNGDRTLLEVFGEQSKPEMIKEKNKQETKKEKKEKKKDKKEKKTNNRKEEKKQEAKKESEEKSEKEKIFTRHDFLKDFKKFDPDKDSGKENKEPNKKERKDVIVTLTSKREEED